MVCTFHLDIELPWQALEFFFFAILIGVVTFVFAVMSFFYKYVDISKPVYEKPTDERTGLIHEDEKEAEDIFDKKSNADSLPYTDSESTGF